METPFEAIMRLARASLNSGDDAAAFAEFLLSFPDEDMAGFIQVGVETGRRVSVIYELRDYERRMPSCENKCPPAFLFDGRYERVSGGRRLLETPEWCVAVAMFLRGVGRNYLCANPLIRETLGEDAVEMVGFLIEDDGASRLVRSFWRSFFHEVVRDPIEEPNISRNKRLMMGALALYKKARESQPELQIEIGALLAETLHYTNNEVHDELLPLFRKDRGFFEERGVVQVLNVLDFYGFLERLEFR